MNWGHLLQMRLKLTTSTLICSVLSYKYNTLPDSITGGGGAHIQRVYTGNVEKVVLIQYLDRKQSQRKQPSWEQVGCRSWGLNSHPRPCSTIYCLISTACWLIAPLALVCNSCSSSQDILTSGVNDDTFMMPKCKFKLLYNSVVVLCEDK